MNENIEQNLNGNNDEAEELRLQELEEDFKMQIRNYEPNWKLIIKNRVNGNEQYYSDMCAAFCSNLKSIRQYWDKSLQEMGDDIGYTRQYLSSLETGKRSIRKIPYDKLDTICRKYDVSVPYLLGFEEAKEYEVPEDEQLPEFECKDPKTGKIRKYPGRSSYASKVFTVVDYYFWENPNCKYAEIEERLKGKPLRKLMVFEAAGIKELQKNIINKIGADDELLCTLEQLLSVDEKKRKELITLFKTINRILNTTC